MIGDPDFKIGCKFFFWPFVCGYIVFFSFPEKAGGISALRTQLVLLTYFIEVYFVTGDCSKSGWFGRGSLATKVRGCDGQS